MYGKGYMSRLVYVEHAKVHTHMEGPVLFEGKKDRSSIW